MVDQFTQDCGALDPFLTKTMRDGQGREEFHLEGRQFGRYAALLAEKKTCKKGYIKKRFFSVNLCFSDAF